jgi:hypothetical protein
MVTTNFAFIHNSKDDMPTGDVQLALSRNEWTVGGMAEAGWFLVGEMRGGGPIFSRTPSVKVTVRQ